MKTIFSETAKAIGWGKDGWKSVTCLSREEREHVRNGTARIIISDCPLSGGGNRTGTKYRMVIFLGKNRFSHRLPDASCEIP